MLRTFIKSSQKNFNIAIVIPEDYLDKELEIIVFKKDEGLEINKKQKSDKLSEKYRGVFSKKDAESFENHSKKMRNEWKTI